VASKELCRKLNHIHHINFCFNFIFLNEILFVNNFATALPGSAHAAQGCLAGIRRMASDCEPILIRLTVFGKPISPAGQVSGAAGRRMPRRALENVEFAVIETHLSRQFHRTRDTRTG
jgi:hypothetical protein